MQEGTEVLVVMEHSHGSERASGLWRRIKMAIAAELPDLGEMSPDAVRQEFDQLSNLIAERMPYATVEQFERAMRGDEYGLAGHQHLRD